MSHLPPADAVVACALHSPCEADAPFMSHLPPADAVVANGDAVPYPPGTTNLHHEIELVVALKSGGRNIPSAKANDCIYGYAVGLDMTRRDLQDAAKKAGRATGVVPMEA